MKKHEPRTASECEYRVGDDICRAVRAIDKIALRGKECRNGVKDTCCYACRFREKCEIRCDLLEHENRGENPERADLVSSHVLSVYSDMECGDCLYYLKPECPRDYKNDTELWRRQEPCDTFKPRRSDLSQLEPEP